MTSHVIVTSITYSYWDSETNGWDGDTILGARIANKTTAGTAVMLVSSLLGFTTRGAGPRETVCTTAASVVFIKSAPLWRKFWRNPGILDFQESFVVAFRSMIREHISSETDSSQLSKGPRNISSLVHTAVSIDMNYFSRYKHSR
jgi:hypothetical protein